MIAKGTAATDQTATDHARVAQNLPQICLVGLDSVKGGLVGVNSDVTADKLQDSSFF